MRKIFLDDIRNPKDCLKYMKYGIEEYSKDDWLIIRSFEEFKKYVNSSIHTMSDLPNLMSFDHDLLPEHYTPEEFWDDYSLSEKFQENSITVTGTGLECMEYLINHIKKLDDYEKDSDLYLPDLIVHSANPVGADRIRGTYDFFRGKINVVEKVSRRDKSTIERLTEEKEYYYNKLEEYDYLLNEKDVKYNKEIGSLQKTIKRCVFAIFSMATLLLYFILKTIS